MMQRFKRICKLLNQTLNQFHAGASDDKIEMLVKGVDGSAKLNYEMDVKVVQEASEAVIGKLARDTGGQADKLFL